MKPVLFYTQNLFSKPCFSPDAIDKRVPRGQDVAVVFNHATSFSRLTHRQTSRRKLVFERCFYVCTPRHKCAFLNGRQWQGGYTPAGSMCRSANPAICLPPNTFSSVTAANRPHRKGHIMTTRKAFSRPIIAHPLRTFPNLIQASAFVDRLTDSNNDAYRYQRFIHNDYP